MNNSEQFGEFMTASNPHITPAPSLNEITQNTNNFIVDNAVIYKKLIELEIEIRQLKAMVDNINYPQPIYYSQPQGTIMPIWTSPINNSWRERQNQFR